MRKIIFTLCILQLTSLTISYGQFYNDGAEVTIQENAFIHIQGDFINQGGIVFNEGLIELGGNWINTVIENPLSPGTGEVSLVGMDHNIGGEFNTLFNVLSVSDDQSLTLDRTIGIFNAIDLANGTINLNRNTLHILSPLNTALLSNNGGILAETSDIYSYVRWDVAETSQQEYTIPFINENGNQIPLSFQLNEAGIGDEAYMLFSTYGTANDNMPLPIDVTNIDLQGDVTGLAVVDRYWIVEGIDYTSLPSSSLTLSFDPSSEVVGDNTINIDELEVINWDGIDTWNAIEGQSNGTGSLTTDDISQYGEFSIWSNTTTSVIDTEKLVDLAVFPNPSQDAISLKFDSPENEVLNVMVIDNMGRVVMNNESLIFQGENELTYDVNALSSGSYQILIIGQSINAVKKFSKI
jgi:hypothetical protein